MDDREDHDPPFVRPTRHVLHRVTLAICAAAAVAEPGVWVASGGGLSDSDVVLIPLLSAPYLFLALYAWLQRGRTAASWVLLVATFVLAALGLAVAGAHLFRSLTSGAPAPSRDAGIGLMSCFRWLMVFVIGGLSVLVGAVASASSDRPGPPRRRRPTPAEEDDWPRWRRGRDDD
jgi:hypothetical protein